MYQCIVHSPWQSVCGRYGAGRITYTSVDSRQGECVLLWKKLDRVGGFEKLIGAVKLSTLDKFQKIIQVKLLEYLQKNHQPSYSVSMKVIDKLIKAVINWGSKIILIGAWGGNFLRVDVRVVTEKSPAL